MDAINAVIAQDGQLLAGQVIDVNLVTSPKAHQKSAKRDSTKDSCDSNDSSDGNSKRPRVEAQVNGLSNANSSGNNSNNTGNGSLVTVSSGHATTSGTISTDHSLLLSSNSQIDQSVDILICGTCKSVFTCLSEFMQHKKSSCRLRFVCRCR